MTGDTDMSYPWREESRIQCLECGRWFRALPRHLSRGHELSDEDYRLKHQIPVGVPLVCGEWSETISQRNLERESKRTLTARGPTAGYTQRESVRIRRTKDYAELARAGTASARQKDKTAERRVLLKPYPVTVAQAAERLGCTSAAAYNFLSYCVARGRLWRTGRGLYGDTVPEVPPRLIGGPYHTPNDIRAGDLVECACHGATRVSGFTSATISWPYHAERYAPQLIVVGGLISAIRTESSLAIQYHWGVSKAVVRNWRRKLGVGRVTPGTQLRYTEATSGFSPEDIREIRRLYRNGSTCREIAAPRGVSPGAIQAILTGRNWGSVPDPLGPITMRPGGLKAEKSPHSKLNWDLAREIRAEYDSGISKRQLAKKYGVGFTTIYEIVTNQRWIEQPKIDPATDLPEEPT